MRRRGLAAGASAAWLSAFVVVGAVGCEARLLAGARCERASECAAPLVCGVGGRCREACASSRDCPIGLHCVRDPGAASPEAALRTCALADEACPTTPCASGLACVERRCVNTCARDGECPDGRCATGACVAIVLAPADAALDGGGPTDAPVGPALDVGEPADAPDAADGWDGGPTAALDAGERADALDAGDVPDPLDAATAADAGADAALVSDGGLRGGEEGVLAFGPPTSGDEMGWSVAITTDGTRAVVGAPSQAGAGVSAVFVRAGATWSLEDVLASPAPTLLDRFGASVAVSGDGTIALVGAELDDVGSTNCGSALVFARVGTTWTFRAQLGATSPAAGDRFGAAVAVAADGTRAIVGAPGDGRPGRLEVGSATVFVRSGSLWTAESTLVAGDGSANDHFGTSVALSADGSRALVGVGEDDTAGGVDAGSVRVFLRTGTTWTDEATLLASDGASGDLFGSSVALSADGSRALVGAHRDDTARGADAGSARVLVRAGTTWTETATLTAPDGAFDDAFGRSVALDASGDRALVGAVLDDTSGPDAGSVRLWTWSGSTWSQTAVLVASAGAAYDQLGISVALSGDGVRGIAGAHRDEIGGVTAAGSARIFVLGP